MRNRGIWIFFALSWLVFGVTEAIGGTHFDALYHTGADGLERRRRAVVDDFASGLARLGLDDSRRMRALDVIGIGDLVDGTEDNMTKHNFLKIWSVVVGAMDALTGLVLIFAPAAVLRVLRIEAPSVDSLVYLSWIGVFVMAVGLSYGLALGKHRGRGETVWMFTSLVRILVAVFLIIQITRQTMAPAWIVVALSDGFVALVQMTILRKGWWREGTR